LGEIEILGKNKKIGQNRNIKILDKNKKMDKIEVSKC